MDASLTTVTDFLCAKKRSDKSMRETSTTYYVLHHWLLHVQILVMSLK